uniref:Uncharacterized protein n=1 Tax=Trichogramma kaykai TaxID=54128 RepID=A0ABD2X986_9HYME
MDATQCPPAAAAAAAAACGPQPSRSGRPGAGISARTRNLAKTMNADIVQAEPLDKGAIDNIIIPAGAINADKTTIVSLPPPPPPHPETTVLPSSTRVDHATATGCCPVANKSAQVIAESLDEQEAAEAAVVNSKLQHLQQARRDFVMSVADVGGTAISLEAADLHVSDISAPAQLLSDVASPPRLYRCPSLDDPYLKPECGRDHPQVAAARDYLQDKRFEDMFARYARRDDGDLGELGGDVDGATDFLDQEFLDTLEPGDLIDLDDDDFDVDAAAADDVDYCDRHRAKQRTAIPRRRCEPYRYEPDNLERLHKFCDPANYPHYRPSPPHRSSHHRDHRRHHRHHRRRGDGSSGAGRAQQPPPGRENLPEDLWDLQDPWANNNCPDQQRDLMDFSKDDDC